MKKCPTCNRTFEDTLTYCLADGSLLDAPFDPQATLIIPEPRQTEPPPTEVLPQKEEAVEEMPPTIGSRQPQQKAEELVSTIAAPVPKVELPLHSPSPAQLYRKSNRSPLMMIGVGALLLIGLIFFIIANRTGSSTENSNKANEPQSASSTSAQPASRSQTTSANAASGKVIDITSSNYEAEVLNSKTPVLLYFWATWSVPDREFSPIVEALAREYAGRIKFVRADFDENDKLREKFNVASVPELVVIKDGVEQQRILGETPKENLKLILDKYADNP